MRGSLGLTLLGIALLAGCSNASGPERHSLLGRWQGDVGTATIEMALSETARAVTGAGRWVSPDGAIAFSVSGTNTGENVSLHLEFEDAPAINLLGAFLDEDVIEGSVAGAGIASQPVTLTRVEED